MIAPAALPISAASTRATATHRLCLQRLPLAAPSLRAACGRGRRPLITASRETHGPSALQLVFRGGAALSTSGCDLADASPVLRGVLARELPDPGVLRLPEEDAKDWEVALQLMRPGSYGPHLVDWDNVHRLLRLADKFDMVALRGCCAHFLSLHASEMDLGSQLASPKNPLQAATLLETYCTHCPHEDSMEPYVEEVEGALERAIDPPDAAAAGPAVEKVQHLTEQEEYRRVVAPIVQELVEHAMEHNLSHAAYPQQPENERT